MELFKLRGDLSRSQNLILGLAGFVILIIVWWVVAEMLSINRPVIDGFDSRLESSIGKDPAIHQLYLDSIARVDSINFANATEFEKVYPLFPTPFQVVKSFPELIQKDELIQQTGRSLWLNIQGYFWAIFIAVPLGFLIGLFPLFRGLFSKQVDAMRFLPLTALTGLFIIWFGIEDQMKIAFLAFGILVYLLPVVSQRVFEVASVYLKTVFTLGATDWQTVKTVYFPSVMSRLMDDIRVLTAISWTYIIIAELLNRQGGIGSLMYIKARQGQIEKVFAGLIVIIVIGFLQDRIFQFIDKRIFPHKYMNTQPKGLKESQSGILLVLGGVLFALLLQVILPSAGWVMGSLLPVILIGGVLFVFYGEFKIAQNTIV
jgi:NitT/TauT family transport system permease protein